MKNRELECPKKYRRAPIQTVDIEVYKYVHIQSRKFNFKMIKEFSRMMKPNLLKWKSIKVDFTRSFKSSFMSFKNLNEHSF